MKDTAKKSFLRLPYFFGIWLVAFLTTMACLSVGRLLLWIFPAGLDFFSGETLLAWKTGLRFDLLVASYAATPILLLWLISLGVPALRRANRALRLSRCWCHVWTVLLILISAANFGFFREYRDQFNVWTLGLFNDDAGAVFGTVLEDYPWQWYALAVAAAAALLCGFALPRCFRKAVSIAARLGAGGGQRRFRDAIVCLAVIIILIPIVYRGGIARRPPRLRDAAVCETDAANRLVVNPVFALKHVLLDVRLVSNNGKRPAFARRDVRRQAAVAYGEEALTAKTVEELIRRENVRLGNAEPPRRIYLFVMESYDRWPMLDKYAAMGLCNSLLEMERRGASSDNFISGASGTMLSLSALMSGVPHVDVAQNYRPRGQIALPTATARLFGRLGYKTRFAYCGYGLWQNVADYAKKQGFDEIVLGSDVPDCPDALKGEWGVPDGFLFRELEKIADADGDEPVFTLVMSASYHPPYNLDLEAFGCEPCALPDSLESEYDGRFSMRLFSHLKYADRELGKFVKSVSEKYPDSLFAVTGDHYSRRFLNGNPTLAESKQVPFVLFGAGVPAGTKLPFGTHADVVPTLLSLCAPDGFEYPSFGVSLFSDEARSRRSTFGENVVLHAGGGVSYLNPSLRYGKELSDADFAEMRSRADAERALAWHYFEKGNDLPEPDSARPETSVAELCP